MLTHPPIRTLTLGLADAHPISPSAIAHASKLLHNAQTRFTDFGYEVQTLRLSTRPLFDDLPDESAARRLSYAQSLQRMLDDADLSFCSLGTIRAARPTQSLGDIEQVVDIIATTTALNMTVHLADNEYGLREEVAIPIANVMRRLAHETNEGFGNFRFAMLANVEAGCPFFPTAYHAGPTSLSLGLQGANIVLHALTKPIGTLTHMTEEIRHALIEHATPTVTLAQGFAQEHNIAFGGIDLSPAPLADKSIVAALETYSGSHLGSAGTLATVAALTQALKSTGLPTCGYNGVMLPVLEDAVLGQRWKEDLVNVHQLLMYSAVCGTGLDTIPLAGNTSVEAIARLLLDVATLALRLKKPLSARLFPVPNKGAGEMTAFSSPYLTNTIVKELV